MVGEVTTIREQLRDIPGERVVTHYESVGPSTVRRISWGAVVAGWAVGFTCQLVLTTLGAGIGLAVIEPAAGNDPGSGFAIGAGIWWLLTGLVSLFIGGLVSGRLAGWINPIEATLHGVLVWAVAAVVGVLMLTTSAASLIGGALGPMAQGFGQGVSERAAATGNDVTSGLGAMGDELMNRAESIAGGPEPIFPEQGGAGSPPQPATQDRIVLRDSEGNPVTEAEARRSADDAADVMASASIWSFFGLLLGGVAAGAGGAIGRPTRTDVVR